MQVGDAAVFAFAIKSQLLIGTRSDLSSKLIAFIDDPSLLSLPILRLEVVDFCNLVSRRKMAATRAYQFLERISRFSADYWRDKTYLTSRARWVLRRYAEMLGGRDSIKPAWLDSIAFRLKDSEPILTLSQGLGDHLREMGPKNWRRTLASELSVYVKAFDENLKPLHFDILEPESDRSQLDSEIQQPSEVSQNEDEDSIVFAIGRTAANSSRQIGGQSHTVVAAAAQANEWGEISIDDAVQKFFDTQREYQGRDRRLPMNFLVVDASPQLFSSALTFLKRLPRQSDVRCIVLYRTRQGIRNLPEESDLAELVELTAGVTVVLDNDIPLGDSLRNTSLGTSLSALAPLLSSKRAQVSKGISLFGMGWTRGGVSRYQQAISRSIAAAANPWLPISKAHHVRSILYSVGRPPDAFAKETKRLFNQILERDKPIYLDAEWRQRRFVPSGSVPARFEFLAELEYESPSPSQIRFASAARTILLARGFSVSNLYGEDNLAIKAKCKGGTVEIFGSEEIKATTQRSIVRILLMHDGAELQQFLKRSGPLTTICPLLLGDLFFLNGDRGPRWSAQVLAHFAYPKKRWPSTIKPFLESALLNHVRENRRHHFNVGRMPKRTSISSVEVTITQTERLPGRRMSLYGSMLINFGQSSKNRSSGRSPGTHERMFTATLGPDEFQVE